MTIKVEWCEYDVIVVGSGGAGSMAARAAADEGGRVLVKTQSVAPIQNIRRQRNGPRCRDR